MSYRLRLTAEALARTRFALSPLGEAVAALQTLRLERRRLAHLRGWADWAAPRIPRFEQLDALFARSPLAPAFLGPCPSATYPELEDELAVVAATPAGEVRASVRRLELAVDVDLPLVVEELRVAFEVLVRPYWRRARRIIDADIARRSRTLATGGFDGLFSALHRDVAWEGDSVRIWTSRVRDRTEERVYDVGGEGLVLIPSVFLWPHIYFKSTKPEMTFGYPARGAATLWLSGRQEPEPLRALLGPTRARLVSLLAIPSTPTELAAALGVTVGAVSQQLGVLRANRLVDSTRSGRSVVYMRTERGDALLDPR